MWSKQKNDRMSVEKYMHNLTSICICESAIVRLYVTTTCVQFSPK